jgi:transposase
VGRHSPFVIELTSEERAELESRVARYSAQHRDIVRARIVLLAAQGMANVDIASSLGVAPNTVLKWRRRFFHHRLDGLKERRRSGRPKVFTAEVVAEVKAIACELPARRGLPLSRISASEIVRELVDGGLAATISVSTVSRWLARDPLRPWRFRSWIFPRDPAFADKAGRVLDLYARIVAGRKLRADEFVLCADEKTSIQARCRCHPTLAPGQARAMRVEHEYARAGALQYMAAWDVHRGVLMGRCEDKTGIEPFRRLVAQVMSQEPYASARQVFWVVDNGSSHRGQAACERVQADWPRARLIHLPVHASWLSQVEIVFSILQRKALTPNDFTDLDMVRARIEGFEGRFNQTAQPFDWRYTRADLNALLTRLEANDLPVAA